MNRNKHYRRGDLPSSILRTESSHINAIKLSFFVGWATSFCCPPAPTGGQKKHFSRQKFLRSKNFCLETHPTIERFWLNLMALILSYPPQALRRTTRLLADMI